MIVVPEYIISGYLEEIVAEVKNGTWRTLLVSENTEFSSTGFVGITETHVRTVEDYCNDVKRPLHVRVGHVFEEKSPPFIGVDLMSDDISEHGELLGDYLGAVDFATTEFSEEVLIASAVGGETEFSVTFTGTVNRTTFTLYLNDLELSESFDYTFNAVTGAGVLLIPLANGDLLKTSDFSTIIGGEMVTGASWLTSLTIGIVTTHQLVTSLLYYYTKLRLVSYFRLMALVGLDNPHVTGRGPSLDPDVLDHTIFIREIVLSFSGYQGMIKSDTRVQQYPILQGVRGSNDD